MGRERQRKPTSALLAAKGEGLLIKHGEIIKKVPESALLDTLREELLNWKEA